MRPGRVMVEVVVMVEEVAVVVEEVAVVVVVVGSSDGPPRQ